MDTIEYRRERRKQLVLRCVGKWRQNVRENQLLRAGSDYRIFRECQHAIRVWKTVVANKKEEWRQKIVFESNVRFLKRRFALNAWLRWQVFRVARSRRQGRALLHWSRRLQSKVFVIWKDAVVISKQRRHENQMALKLWSVGLLARSWDTWRMSIQTSRMEREKMQGAARYAALMTQRRCFNRWRDFIPLERELKRRSKLLAKWLERHTAIRVLQLWSVIARHMTKEQELAVIADAHARPRRLRTGLRAFVLTGLFARGRARRDQYDRRLLRNALDKMLKMYRTRRRERANKSLADSHWRRTSLIRTLQGLRQIFAERKEEQERLQRAGTFRRYFVKVSTVQTWRLHSHTQQSNRLLQDIGKSFRHRRLLRSGLLAFAGVVNKRGQADEMEEKVRSFRKATAVKLWRCFTFERLREWRSDRAAVRHRYYSVLATFFDAWKTVIEQEKAKERALCGRLDKVWDRERRKVVRAWADLARTSLVDKSRIRQAKSFQQRYALEAWRHVVLKSKRAEQDAKRAAEHHRHACLLRFFGLWDVEVYKQQDKRRAEQQLIQTIRKLLDAGICRRLMRVWVPLAFEARADRVAREQGDACFRSLTYRRHFRAWCVFVQSCRRSQAMVARADAYYSRDSMRKCMSVWREALGNRRLEKHKYVTSLLHWSRQLSKRAFAGWLVYVEYRRKKRDKQRQAFHMREEYLLKKGVVRWIESAVEMRKRRLEVAKDVQTHKLRKTLDLVARIGQHWRRKTRARLGHHAQLPPPLLLGRQPRTSCVSALPATELLEKSLPTSSALVSSSTHSSIPLSLGSLGRMGPRTFHQPSAAVATVVQQLDVLANQPKNRRRPRIPVELLLEQGSRSSLQPPHRPKPSTTASPSATYTSTTTSGQSDVPTAAKVKSALSGALENTLVTTATASRLPRARPRALPKEEVTATLVSGSSAHPQPHEANVAAAVLVTQNLITTFPGSSSVPPYCTRDLHISGLRSEPVMSLENHTDDVDAIEQHLRRLQSM